MSEEEKLSSRSKKTILIIQIAGGAIFGALSIVISFIAAFLPRTPQGLAYFDPVSIIWVMCFLIFGPLAGILCCAIGTVGLMPFDPFAPIGPLMKLAATITLILTYIIFLKLYKQEPGESKSAVLKIRKNYITYGLLGMIFRIGVMVILNIIVYIALGFPMELLGAYLVMVVLINALQSVWDLLIPYLIVFGLKLDEKFEIW